MKQKRKDLTLIITVCLVLILLVGMILSSVFLARKQNASWSYSERETKIDYYADNSEYSFKCVSDFSSALKNYFKKSTLKFLGLDKNVDKLTERIVTVMQDAGIAADRLETIANVIDSNRLPSLIGNISIPFSTVDEFSQWSDNVVLSLTDETMFSLVGSFIHSFLNVTTMTEEELSSFIYHYLIRYSSNEYKLYLALYGKENFIRFFSDTFFAIRILSQTKDKTGLSFGTNAMRSALYQLGRVYLDFVTIDNASSFYKLLGFPDVFPTEILKNYSEDATEIYDDIKGSLGQLLYVFGTFFTEINDESLEAYLKLKKYNEDNYKTIAILNDKKNSGKITEAETEKLKDLLDKKSRLQILVAEKFTAHLTASLQKNDKTYREVLTEFKSNAQKMRYLILILSEPSPNSLQLYGDYYEMIESYADIFTDALDYFKDVNLSEKNIESLNNIEEIAKYAQYFGDGSKLLELYFSSVFNIWITYKANDWGLINNE